MSLFGTQKPQVGSIHLQRLVILFLKSPFSIHNTTGEGWNPYSLFILVLSTLLCVLKTTDEDWDSYRLVGLGPKVAVVYAQNERSCLGPIETCISAPKVAVLHAKTADKGWDLQRQVILVLITPYCKHKTTGDVWDS